MSSLGIKCDAYPGRLNQVSVFINREGTFYGQCSEICGILHSSMPIVIESVSIRKIPYMIRRTIGFAFYEHKSFFTLEISKLRGFLLVA